MKSRTAPEVNVEGSDILIDVDIFSQLSEEDRRRVAGLLEEQSVGNGAVVFKKGDPGDALYIVLSGQLQGTVSEGNGIERLVGSYTKGQYFGELGLIIGDMRKATVQAVTDARLLVLQKKDFDDFLGQNVPAMLQMMKVIAQRKAESKQQQPAIREEMPSSIRVAMEKVAPRVDVPAMEQTTEIDPPGGRTTAAVDPLEAMVASGKVITIFSPKGGVGKSTVAVNLAVAMARARRGGVALLDLSLTFGHVPLLLNLVPKSSLAAANPDALRRLDLPENMDHYLEVHPFSGLRVLAGALNPEEGESVSGEIVGMAIQQLRCHFAYLVVDTGSHFTDPVLATLEASDRILMLCSPEMSVLRDIRECQRILDTVVHVPRERVLYIMNNIFPFRTLSREQLEASLQQKLLAELPYGGDAVPRAALKGETLIEAKPGSPLAKSIQVLAARLTAEGIKSGGYMEKKHGFFR